MTDELHSVRTNIARLLKRSTCKSRPKTAFTVYNFSELSSDKTVETEILIPNRASFETVPFHIKQKDLYSNSSKIYILSIAPSPVCWIIVIIVWAM